MLSVVRFVTIWLIYFCFEGERKRLVVLIFSPLSWTLCCCCCCRKIRPWAFCIFSSAAYRFGSARHHIWAILWIGSYATEFQLTLSHLLVNKGNGKNYAVELLKEKKTYYYVTRCLVFSSETDCQCVRAARMILT